MLEWDEIESNSFWAFVCKGLALWVAYAFLTVALMFVVLGAPLALVLWIVGLL